MVVLPVMESRSGPESVSAQAKLTVTGWFVQPPAVYGDPPAIAYRLVAPKRLAAQLDAL